MKRKTLDILHHAYVNSIEHADTTFEIVENLLNSLIHLPTTDIPEEDLHRFDNFIKGLYTSKMIRQKTFQSTMKNLLIDITIVIIHITIWLNNSKGIGVDMQLTGRRKALEAELEKILSNSKSDTISDATDPIHDRFGLRGIVLNALPDEEATDLLFNVSDYIVPILTRQNRRIYQEFLHWIETNPDIEIITKEKIKFILNLPFNLMIYKDYIRNPKSNNYQSLHYVLALDMFSPYLSGAELELQLRTQKMHETATVGSAAHTEYENNRRQEFKGIFQIDDFSKVGLISDYNSPKNDTHGLHFSKQLIEQKIEN